MLRAVTANRGVIRATLADTADQAAVSYWIAEYALRIAIARIETVGLAARVVNTCRLPLDHNHLFRAIALVQSECESRLAGGALNVADAGLALDRTRFGNEGIQRKKGILATRVKERKEIYYYVLLRRYLSRRSS